MLKINRTDNPEAELSQIALMSNNKHTNQQANKAWNISFHQSVQSGAFGSCMLFILLLFKAMNKIPVAGTTKETAADIFTILPRRCCWTVCKGGWVGWREKKPPTLGRERSLPPQSLRLTFFCLALKEWDIFVPCNWMLLSHTTWKELTIVKQDQTREPMSCLWTVLLNRCKRSHSGYL